MRQTKLLSDIADIQTGPFGSQLHNEDYVIDGTPIVTVEHLGNKRFTTQNLPCVSDKDRQRLSKYLLAIGDVVFSRVGSVDRCSYVGPEHNGWMFSGRCLRVRSRQNIIAPEFLYYYFTQEPIKQFVRNIAVGATMPSINTSLLGEVQVKFPPLAEQRAIAATLSCLDDKIALNNKINANLEAQAQAIFKSWFVNFEPFWNGEFVESELGMIPKGWRYALLNEICEINQETLKKTDIYSTLEYIDISNVTRGEVLNIQEFIRGNEPSRARRRVKHGDTILSTVRPERGSYFLCMYPAENLVVSTGFAVITPKVAPWSFVYTLLSDLEFIKSLAQLSHGSAYPALRVDLLAIYSFPFPAKEKILTDFHRICSPVYEQIWTNRKMNRKLAAIRDALLPKLMSGEIEVPVADLATK